MSDELVVISPEIAPGSGGLADYTLRVLEQWRGMFPARVIIPENGRAVPAMEDDLRVESVKRDAPSLRATLPASGGKVLVQYSAYGYDRFGYPRWLLRALSEWKEQSGGVLVLMFHEIWTFWPVLNKNYVVQQLHRRDIRTILGKADAVFTSTSSQAEHLRNLEPGCSVEVLPVGSNIQPLQIPAPTRRSDVAVLFGLAGTRVRTLQAMRGDLQALVARGRIRKIITAGAGDGEPEQALLAELNLSEGFEQRGAVSQSEISATLLSASFGISDQDELSLTKSGTFMAYANHGIYVLSRHADPAKPEPLCWLTTPRELLDGIESAELARRSAQLLNWQQRSASWPHIADQLACALGVKNPTEPALS